MYKTGDTIYIKKEYQTPSRTGIDIEDVDKPLEIVNFSIYREVFEVKAPSGNHWTVDSIWIQDSFISAVREAIEDGI